MRTPILQFGTSRFLQAHVDLFVSQALARGDALGPITIVQTSRSLERAKRLSGLAAPAGFSVLIRGLEQGVAIERSEQVTSVVRALSAQDNWPEVTRIFVEEADVVISNTGDAGYDIDPDTCDDLPEVPRAFPEKLLYLLRARYSAGARPITILPCELISRNGEVLRRLVHDLAIQRSLPNGFIAWLSQEVVWGVTLVDRIVSEALEPAGAIAEPYALWAIEDQPKLLLPCTHSAIQVLDSIEPCEKLKLHILNLGHTVLADIWRSERRPRDETVREILQDPDIHERLMRVYSEEVLPAFASWGLEREAQDYVAVTLERFQNPFLDHRLRDIAQNHAQKVARRLVPIATDNPAARTLQGIVSSSRQQLRMEPNNPHQAGG